MPGKLTYQQFIQKANKIHNTKYNYELFEYINAHSKGIIICPLHGKFLQSASNHIYGENGCIKCIKVIDLETFIKNANVIHNYCYDYSKVIYINSNTPIKIICKKHGTFEQSINNHLSKSQGCPACGKIKNTKNKSFTYEQFTQKANKIHNTKYNYELFKYINAHSKGIIICPLHGKFLQSAGSHMYGSGCPACSRHNYNISSIETKWLDSLNISKLARQCKITFDNGKYAIADGYDSITNTVYEFYGDYWHGNPDIFNQDDINPSNKKTYKELYEQTLLKKQKYKIYGYNVVEIWENDYNIKNKFQKRIHNL